MIEHLRKLLLGSLVAGLMLPLTGVLKAWGGPSGEEIVQRCDLDTNAGKDQRSQMTVLLRDAAGNEKKNIYRRYWKNYLVKIILSIK